MKKTIHHTIALFGTKGAGKTSFIEALYKEMENHKSIKLESWSDKVFENIEKQKKDGTRNSNMLSLNLNFEIKGIKNKFELKLEDSVGGKTEDSLDDEIDRAWEYLGKGVRSAGVFIFSIVNGDANSLFDSRGYLRKEAFDKVANKILTNHSNYIIVFFTHLDVDQNFVKRNLLEERFRDVIKKSMCGDETLKDLQCIEPIFVSLTNGDNKDRLFDVLKVFNDIDGKGTSMLGVL